MEISLVKAETKDAAAIHKMQLLSFMPLLEKYQGKGIAQKAFQLVAQIYADADVWELDTVLQEQGNCYLYEKIGYHQTGKTEIINNMMTLVFYEKHVLREGYDAAVL